MEKVSRNITPLLEACFGLVPGLWKKGDDNYGVAGTPGTAPESRRLDCQLGPAEWQ